MTYAWSSMFILDVSICGRSVFVSVVIVLLFFVLSRSRSLSLIVVLFTVMMLIIVSEDFSHSLSTSIR